MHCMRQLRTQGHGSHWCTCCQDKITTAVPSGWAACTHKNKPHTPSSDSQPSSLLSARRALLPRWPPAAALRPLLRLAGRASSPASPGAPLLPAAAALLPDLRLLPLPGAEPPSAAAAAARGLLPLPAFFSVAAVAAGGPEAWASTATGSGSSSTSKPGGRQLTLAATAQWQNKLQQNTAGELSRSGQQAHGDSVTAQHSVLAVIDQQPGSKQACL